VILSIPCEPLRRRFDRLGHPQPLKGILDGFVEVARVLGAEDRGVSLARRCQATVDAVRDRTRTMPRARVACLEWIDPVFAMGNWGPELVEAAGGEPLLGRPGEHSTTTPWEAIVREDPDVIVMAACGFDVERTASEMHVMEGRPGWRDLRAVREGRVFVADGNRYFNRSGPSAFETAELLAEMLHPGSFEPRHEGRDWRAWR
jgi:iron complex transport system substrate-binding protein